MSGSGLVGCKSNLEHGHERGFGGLLAARIKPCSLQATLNQAEHVALFHLLDADLSTRKLRVQRRNVEKGTTYLFDVTPTMVEAMESHFERLCESEPASAHRMGVECAVKNSVK